MERPGAVEIMLAPAIQVSLVRHVATVLQTITTIQPVHCALRPVHALVMGPVPRLALVCAPPATVAPAAIRVRPDILAIQAVCRRVRRLQRAVDMERVLHRAHAHVPRDSQVPVAVRVHQDTLDTPAAWHLHA